MPSSSKPSVFVSYSHADVEWMTRLRVHLKPLERDATISVWTDVNVKAGQKWKDEIAAGLKSAKVAVLLISADFLASDFIANEELPALLSAAKHNGTAILPMIIKPSRFAQTVGLGQFQAVNPVSEPVINMPPGAQEQAFVNLADRIAEVLREGQNSEPTEIESQDDELSAPEKVFHPGNRGSTRGALEACKFFVSPFYDKTKLWKYYGDIQVEILHDASGEKVFLIPSGAAPPRLRDTAYLRTPEGEAVIEQKRRAAEEFIEKWRNQDLPGFKFTMTTRTGETRTKVYCVAYDRCLVEEVKDKD